MTDNLFGEPLVIPLEAQIECVTREIAMRERVYPRWIGQGKMTPVKADREIQGMKAVLDTLIRLRDRRIPIVGEAT